MMYFLNRFTLTKILHILVLAIGFLLIIVLSVQAQTPPPSPAAAPLDGFTGLLLAGGIGAGYYALRNRKED